MSSRKLGISSKVKSTEVVDSMDVSESKYQDLPLRMARRSNRRPISADVDAGLFSISVIDVDSPWHELARAVSKGGTE